MLPRHRPALLLALCALCSTGCAPHLAPVVVRQQVPAGLLECQAAPLPPGPEADDAALAYFILDLAGAGDDCRSKLGRVRELLKETTP